MKYIKLLVFMFIIVFFISSCEMDFNNTTCNHEYQLINIIEESTCAIPGKAEYECSLCHKTKTDDAPLKDHDLISVSEDSTCLSEGYHAFKCQNCDFLDVYQVIPKKEHNIKVKIEEESINGEVGTKRYYCENCGTEFNSYKYVNNGYSAFGKLHVGGTHLLNSENVVVQLLGISTHGLQWFGKYVNYDTLKALKDAFNVNVYRFSLYTSEGGYCDCSSDKKEQLYQTVVNGVKIATELDMYAIIDWHMLGADDSNDENPLYYLDEAKEFFNRISLELKDYDNVLYEIMNEPNGSTTWSDCKEYAEEIIPVIRANVSDAIILVGSPRWSTDLENIQRDPLDFDNIMYTYHFYAGDNMTISRVTSAYNNGLPIFISEHGGMLSSGDGALNVTNINKWYDALDSRRISYVAWNLSNSKGSSSIIVQGSTIMDSFVDSNLKEWGIFYKKHIKKVLGLE